MAHTVIGFNQRPFACTARHDAHVHAGLMPYAVACLMHAGGVALNPKPQWASRWVSHFLDCSSLVEYSTAPDNSRPRVTTHRAPSPHIGDRYRYTVRWLTQYTTCTAQANTQPKERPWHRYGRRAHPCPPAWYSRPASTTTRRSTCRPARSSSPRTAATTTRASSACGWTPWSATSTQCTARAARSAPRPWHCRRRRTTPTC